MYSSPTAIIWHTFTKASWELWSPGRLVKPQCRDQDCGGTFWEVRLTAKCLACPPMVLATEMETSPYLCGLPQPHLALGLAPVPHTKDLWGVMLTACWAVETEWLWSFQVLQQLHMNNIFKHARFQIIGFF